MCIERAPEERAMLLHAHSLTTPAGAHATAVVTGGNRGLGLALSEELALAGARVVLGVRDEAHGAAAVAELAGRGLLAEAYPLDVACWRSVAAFGDRCERELGGVDLLINNAAVCEVGWHRSEVQRTLRTNVLGPVLLTRRLLPGMLRRGHGLVLGVSSGDGELCYLSPPLQADLRAADTHGALLRVLARASPPRDAYGASPAHGPSPAYSLSKAALNCATRMQAAALPPRSGVWVGAVCPGDVLTRMTTDAERGTAVAPAAASRDVLELVRRAYAPDSTLASGRFWRYGEELSW